MYCVSSSGVTGDGARMPFFLPSFAAFSPPCAGEDEEDEDAGETSFVAIPPAFLLLCLSLLPPLGFTVPPPDFSPLPLLLLLRSFSAFLSRSSPPPFSFSFTATTTLALLLLLLIIL